MQQISSTVLFKAEFKKGTFVILDDGSADYISSTIGLPALLELGCVGVSSLHTFTPKDIASALFLSPNNHLSSVTILISTLLSEHLHSLCLAIAPHTHTITILCAHSEAAHHDESPSIYSNTCYTNIAHRLTTTLASHGHVNTRITIKFLPMPCIPLGETAFVLPAVCNAATTACAHGYTLGYSGRDISQDDDDDDDDVLINNNDTNNTINIKPLSSIHTTTHGISVVAHALAHLAAELDVRPEAFCIGTAAKAIGHSLSFIPPIKSMKTNTPPTTPAAFVLIDRSMDITASIEHKDLLVQRCIDTLRQSSMNTGSTITTNTNTTTTSTNDRMLLLPALQSCISMTTDIPDQDQQEQSDPYSSFLPGSLLHPTDEHATAHLAFLLTRKERDAVLFIRKWLREAMRKESIQAKGKFRPGTGVGANELRALCNALRTAPSVLTQGLPPSSLIQLTEAIIQTIDDDVASKWQVLKSTEELLIAACREGDSDGACEQLIDLCTSFTRAARLYSDNNDNTNSNNSLMIFEMMDIIAMVLLVYCTIPQYKNSSSLSSSSTMNNNRILRSDQEGRLIAALVDTVFACCACWVTCDDAEKKAHEDVPWLSNDLKERLLQLAYREQEIQTEQNSSNDDNGDDNGGDDENATTMDDSMSSMREEKRALKLEVHDAVHTLLHRIQHLSSTSYAAMHNSNNNNNSTNNSNSSNRFASALNQVRNKKFNQWDNWGDDDTTNTNTNTSTMNDQQQWMINNDRSSNFHQSSNTSTSNTTINNTTTDDSLVVRVTKAILDQQPINGLTQANTSLAGLLKSGLGRLGLQKEHHPGEYSTIVIFVIGGISAVEMHEVMACVDAKTAAVTTAAQMMQSSKSSGDDDDGWGGGGINNHSGGGGSEVVRVPKVYIGGSALVSPHTVVLHSLIPSSSS